MYICIYPTIYLISIGINTKQSYAKVQSKSIPICRDILQNNYLLRKLIGRNICRIDNFLDNCVNRKTWN